MNKTVSVNIGGLVFNVEEEAYETLQNYLKTIRTFFTDSDGVDEILNDIEVRIAELFQDMIKPGKQVITMVDVEEVIEIMGQPEAYIDEDHQHDIPDDTAEGQEKSRKMYRDPDDQMVGGVCSGIALYFGWDRAWVRLAFALAFIFFGTGILLYLVLWIILPEAKTTAEKLEMRGEKVNVENIKHHIHRVKDDLQNMNTRDTQSKVRGVIKQLGEGFGKVFGLFCFLLAIFMSTILLYWLFAQDFIISISTTDGPNGFAVADLLELMFTPAQRLLLNVGASFLFLGPIIALFATGFRLSLGIRSSAKIVGVISTVIWITGLIICFVFGLSFGRSVESTYTFEQKVEVAPPTNDLLVVEVANDSTFSNEYRETEDYFWELVEIENDRAIMGWPTLQVAPSESDNFELFIYKTSRGSTQKQAIQLAKGIDYDVHQQGNRLILSPTFSFDKSDKYKWQDIQVELRVPKGKYIKFSEDIGRILPDVLSRENYELDEYGGQTFTMGATELSRSLPPIQKDTVYIDTADIK